MTEGKAEQLLIELVTKLDMTPLERCHNAKGFKNWYDNWKRIHGIDTALVQEIVPMPAEASTEIDPVEGEEIVQEQKRTLS